MAAGTAHRLTEVFAGADSRLVGPDRWRQ